MLYFLMIYYLSGKNTLLIVCTSSLSLGTALLLTRLPHEVALLHTPFYIGSHQHYLTDLRDELTAGSLGLPLLEEVLDFLELFQVELPLLLKGLFFDPLRPVVISCLGCVCGRVRII
jgi:hypothetical protein